MLSFSSFDFLFSDLIKCLCIPGVYILVEIKKNPASSALVLFTLLSRFQKKKNKKKKKKKNGHANRYRIKVFIKNR